MNCELAIVSLYAGDDKQIVLTVTDDAGQPLDITLAEITWKLSVDTRSYPLLTKTSAVGIWIDDAVNGVAVIEVSKEDSQDLQEGLYYHEARVVLNSVRATLVACTTFTVLPTLPQLLSSVPGGLIFSIEGNSGYAALLEDI